MADQSPVINRSQFSHDVLQQQHQYSRRPGSGGSRPASRSTGTPPSHETAVSSTSTTAAVASSPSSSSSSSRAGSRGGRAGGGGQPGGEDNGTATTADQKQLIERAAFDDVVDELNRTRKEVSRALQESKYLHTVVEKLQEANKQQAGEVTALEGQLEEQRAMQDHVKLSFQSELRATTQPLREKVERMEQEAKVAHESVMRQHEQIDGLQKENEALREKEAEAQAAIDAKQTMVEQFEEKIKSLQTSYRAEAYTALDEEARAALYGNDDLQEMLSKQNDAIETIMKQCEELEGRYQTVKQEKDVLSRRFGATEKIKGEVTSQLTEAEGRVKRLSTELEHRKTDRASLELLFLEYETTAKQVEKLKERNRRLKREAERWQSRAFQLTEEVSAEQKEAAEHKLYMHAVRSNTVERNVARQTRRDEDRRRFKEASAAGAALLASARGDGGGQSSDDATSDEGGGHGEYYHHCGRAEERDVMMGGDVDEETFDVDNAKRRIFSRQRRQNQSPYVHQIGEKEQQLSHTTAASPSTATTLRPIELLSLWNSTAASAAGRADEDVDVGGATTAKPPPPLKTSSSSSSSSQEIDVPISAAFATTSTAGQPPRSPHPSDGASLPSPRHTSHSEAELDGLRDGNVDGNIAAPDLDSSSSTAAAAASCVMFVCHACGVTNQVPPQSAMSPSSSHHHRARGSGTQPHVHVHPTTNSSHRHRHQQPQFTVDQTRSVKNLQLSALSHGGGTTGMFHSGDEEGGGRDGDLGLGLSVGGGSSSQQRVMGVGLGRQKRRVNNKTNSSSSKNKAAAIFLPPTAAPAAAGAGAATSHHRLSPSVVSPSPPGSSSSACSASLLPQQKQHQRHNMSSSSSSSCLLPSSASGASSSASTASGSCTIGSHTISLDLAPPPPTHHVTTTTRHLHGMVGVFPSSSSNSSSSSTSTRGVGIMPLLSTQLQSNPRGGGGGRGRLTQFLLPNEMNVVKKSGETYIMRPHQQQQKKGNTNQIVP